MQRPYTAHPSNLHGSLAYKPVKVKNFPISITHGIGTNINSNGNNNEEKQQRRTDGLESRSGKNRNTIGNVCKKDHGESDSKKFRDIQIVKKQYLSQILFAVPAQEGEEVGNSIQRKRGTTGKTRKKIEDKLKQNRPITAMPNSKHLRSSINIKQNMAKNTSNGRPTTTTNNTNSRKINYDSFFYMDRLTNNKIVLGAVKNLYNKAQHHNNHNHNHNQTIVQSNNQTLPSPLSAPEENQNKNNQMQEQVENVSKADNSKKISNSSNNNNDELNIYFNHAHQNFHLSATGNGSGSHGKTNRQRPHSHVHGQKQYSHSKQMQQINDCFAIMKSTKLYQMNNLKSKLFNEPQIPQPQPSQSVSKSKKQNTEIDSMIKKKKQIRQFIQQYVNNLCLNQFRRYVQHSQPIPSSTSASASNSPSTAISIVNPNILSLQKSVSLIVNKISRSNVERILEEIVNSTENQVEKKRIPINIDINDIQFPDQDRLRELLFDRVAVKNMEFQCLVGGKGRRKGEKQKGHEEGKHGLKSKINSSNKQKNQQLKPQKNQNQSTDIDLCQLTFPQFPAHLFKKIPQMPEPQPAPSNPTSTPNSKKLTLKKRQLILSIETGSIYNFLFLIIRYPILLSFTDKMGNNLLHISAKHNQSQIYHILIKKLGVEKLREKNHCGRDSGQIARMFSAADVVRIDQQYRI